MMSLLSSALIVLTAVCGADPLKDPSTASPQQRLSFAKQAAETYRFEFDRQQPPAQLHPQPLLRWNNQIIREDDGFLFIWTEGEKGRPVAGAQFFLVDKIWHHEFQSLSLAGFAASCAANEGQNWSWQPRAAGFEFVTADAVEAPAASAAQRLRQMKLIADRFTAAVDTNADFEHPEQLRLLATPVYRYTAVQNGIQDGAIFAFTQGTNPEILILIEAVTKDDDKSWRYGFARMSSFNLRVYREGQVVWKNERAPVPTPDPASPYYFRLRAQEDHSADVVIATP